FSSEYFVLSGMAAETAPKTLGCVMLDEIPNQSSCAPPQLKPQFASSRFAWPKNLSQDALSFSSIFFLGKFSQNFLAFSGTSVLANSSANSGSCSNATNNFEYSATDRRIILAEVSKPSKINCLIANDWAISPINITVTDLSKLVNLAE